MTIKIVKTPEKVSKSFGKEIFYNQPNGKIREEYIKKETNRKEKLEKYLNISSEATTFNGWLNSRIQLARLNNDVESDFILRAVKEKYNLFKNKDKKFLQEALEIEIIGGWKGKGTIEINNLLFSEDILIKTPIKDKETGEVIFSQKIVQKENVNRILCFIKKWEIGESRMCYEFAETLGESEWEEVWKKRTKVYFLKYYYPVKILEAMGIIKYGGRGEITRIK